jgi:phosphatidylinositol alpha 1,6-mannosyltransferase
LVNPDEENAYRSVVQELIADPELRKQIGLEAREAVADKSWSANNAQLFEHYRSAMQIKDASRENRVA